jgi:hypothetical protein
MVSPECRQVSAAARNPAGAGLNRARTSTHHWDALRGPLTARWQSGWPDVRPRGPRPQNAVLAQQKRYFPRHFGSPTLRATQPARTVCFSPGEGGSPKTGTAFLTTGANWIHLSCLFIPAPQ